VTTGFAGVKRNPERVEHALDRLGETVEAILDETGLSEDEIVELLDPSRQMPKRRNRGRH
jgi:crotonobetainyl-CoA:carnitine CoA-transferase CaiB-like acyl-CoA transferase